MKLLLVLFLFIFLPILVSAEITLENGFWSTSYDCEEWNQGETLDCDGLELGGYWCF